MEKLRDIGVIRIVLLVLAAGLVAAGAGLAQGDEDVSGLIERGEASYVAHCGSCHGAEGQGDGVVAQYLTVRPPDLTRISAGSVEFPFDDVYQVIDGRQVAGHGTREMPVWGPAFRGMDETSNKKMVKEKVVELVYYLKSIQGTGVEEASSAE